MLAFFAAASIWIFLYTTKHLCIFQLLIEFCNFFTKVYKVAAGSAAPVAWLIASSSRITKISDAQLAKPLVSLLQTDIIEALKALLARGSIWAGQAQAWALAKNSLTLKSHEQPGLM